MVKTLAREPGFAEWRYDALDVPDRCRLRMHVFARESFMTPTVLLEPSTGDVADEGRALQKRQGIMIRSTSTPQVSAVP